MLNSQQIESMLDDEDELWPILQGLAREIIQETCDDKNPPDRIVNPMALQLGSIMEQEFAKLEEAQRPRGISKPSKRNLG